MYAKFDGWLWCMFCSWIGSGKIGYLTYSSVPNPSSTTMLSNTMPSNTMPSNTMPSHLPVLSMMDTGAVISPSSQRIGFTWILETTLSIMLIALILIIIRILKKLGKNTQIFGVHVTWRLKIFSLADGRLGHKVGRACDLEGVKLGSMQKGMGWGRERHVEVHCYVVQVELWWFVEHW